MLDETPSKPDEGRQGGMSPALRNVILAVAAVYVLASLYLMFDMRGRLSTSELKVAKLEQQQKDAEEKIAANRVRTNESFEALGQKVGMTAGELAKRTEELHRQAVLASKLSQEQQAQQQQLSAVSGDVSNVKTELGGAKTDIATTRTDLDATKKRLESTIGDLNVQSGLIAHTRDDLETLKHRGDRNYYEFTLTKGESRPVSTISLQLKKADQRKGKFTLNVIADDRTIEKKDRTLFEPMQFYSGREKALFEVVVMNVEKNKISGYLSTPKAAPQPAQ